jgi:hypothetical protein
VRTMRRKSFDVLFATKAGMGWLAQHPTLWRSLFYFTISMGAFFGVCTNIAFAQQYILVRFGILVGVLLAQLIAFVVFGCCLHGLIDACGGGSGNVRGLLCIMGFTSLPFLVLTPLALMAMRLGGLAVLVLPLACIIGHIWWIYLMMRAVEAVYLLSFGQSCVVVIFALLLWALMLGLPIYLVVHFFTLTFFG